MPRKKASESARWSARRVGVSVMNSRSAKKEMKPNMTIVAILPSTKAAAKIATMPHQALIRAVRFSTTATAPGVLALARRIEPKTEARISNTTTPPMRA